MTPTTRHVQAHLDVYATMPAHVFEQIVAAHLRTATSRPLPDEVFGAYWDRWRGADGQAAYLHHVAQFDERHTLEFEDALPELDLPVLLVWGERDAWLDVADARRLHHLLRGSRLEVVPGAGHFCMEDAPERVADLLARFFA